MKNLLLFSMIGLLGCSTNSQTLHHNLLVDVDIRSNSINVIDTITLPADIYSGKEVFFYLNSNLNIKSLDKTIDIVEQGSEPLDSNRAVNLKKYRINMKPGGKSLSIPVTYNGKIKHEIVEGAAEYARGFSETSGIVFEKGVYLAASSYWVPLFQNSMMTTFDLLVKIDKDWSVVSQGERVSKEVVDDKMNIKYVSGFPMDEIYLIAGKWTEYSKQFGKVLVQAFLRTPDEELAQKYIGVTADYLRLYDELIGDYPYSKFALVENFWETGYGMPSFTLLGEKVIRFPWILHSSYPHELLHNYWGNSVFVDYKTGNWCEGITAYMADHLIAEQKGIAEEYRRNSLQKYADYVNEGNDFPLSEFGSRNNSAEEAVGYGKCMMFNDMLRYRVGDQKFKESYSLFYEDNMFKAASFEDIRKSFEEICDEDLNGFFDQWIKRTGAPEIKLSEVSVDKINDSFKISFKLSQTQHDDEFDLLIPVALYFENDTLVKHESVNLTSRDQIFTFTYEARPLKIEIDPQFNVFRKLDRSEVPTSISQVMGSKSGIIVLPSQSKNLNEFRNLAVSWNQIQAAQGNELEIIYDSAIESLPGDKTAWILGFENKFALSDEVLQEYMDYISDESAEKIKTARESGSLVFTVPNPNNIDLTVGFIGVNSSASIMNLARKVTHYGKYGYLAFAGDDAVNTLSGTFPIIASPLSHKFIYDGVTSKITAKIASRKALVY